MGVRELNAQMIEFERRQPVLVAIAVGVIIFLLILSGWGSWPVAIASAVVVGVLRLVLRSVTDRRSQS